MQCKFHPKFLEKTGHLKLTQCLSWVPVAPWVWGRDTHNVPPAGGRLGSLGLSIPFLQLHLGWCPQEPQTGRQEGKQSPGESLGGESGTELGCCSGKV